MAMERSEAKIEAKRILAMVKDGDAKLFEWCIKLLEEKKAGYNEGSKPYCVIDNTFDYIKLVYKSNKNQSSEDGLSLWL
jgi:hypothetical protein